MNTKLHAVCDSQGRPQYMVVTADQVSDDFGARASRCSPPDVKRLLGDRGHDPGRFQQALKDKGSTHLLPRPEAAEETGSVRQASLQSRQPTLSGPRLAQGTVAQGCEIMVEVLKDWPRVVTRYNRCSTACLSAITIANSPERIAVADPPFGVIPKLGGVDEALEIQKANFGVVSAGPHAAQLRFCESP